MIVKDDAQESKAPIIESMPALRQALISWDDSSTSIETPSFWKGVHECERLLEAVWPGSVPSDYKAPRRFGRFSIVRELGRGGFGIVFLAEDSVLRRQVALKVPRPEVMVTPDFRRRFLREAEAASRLDHPHIVPVYEVGEEGPHDRRAPGRDTLQWFRCRLDRRCLEPNSGYQPLGQVAGSLTSHSRPTVARSS